MPFLTAKDASGFFGDALFVAGIHLEASGMPLQGPGIQPQIVSMHLLGLPCCLYPETASMDVVVAFGLSPDDSDDEKQFYSNVLDRLSRDR